MSKLFLDISTSLDGYAAGPNQTMDDPLGVGGEQMHEWILILKAWREAHGLEGGEVDEASPMVEALIGRAGAGIMGRKMFSGGSGPWEDDGNANGWWGDEPPFHHPVFVLTHHEREPLVLGETTFTFVTDGIQSALEQARAAAGDKDIQINGGAQAAQQYLNAGLLDEIHLHVAPVFLGGGERLFVDTPPGTLEQTNIVRSPNGTVHVSYEVNR